MGRKKVQLAWIAKDSMRNTSLRTRKESLIKKARELATLCGIKVCVIVFGEGEQQPDVWPSAPEVAETLLVLRSMPEMKQIKLMMNQEGYLRHRLSKLAEQVRRMENENEELETELLMYQCLAGRSLEDVSTTDVGQLSRMLTIKLKLVNDRLNAAGVAHGGTFAMQDAGTPAAGDDAVLTVATVPASALPAQEEAQGSKQRSKLVIEKTLMEELQKHNSLKEKNQMAETIRMYPQMHNNWQMYARDKAPLEELQTQSLLLKKKPAQASPVECAQNMHDEWLVQAHDRAPMQSTMKAPEEPSFQKPTQSSPMEYVHNMHNECLLQTHDKEPMQSSVAMDLQGLLMLQCPSMAEEALQMHDWPTMETTPSLDSAIEVLQNRIWKEEEAMNVPSQNRASDDGEGNVAPTGYLLTAQ